MKQTRPIRIVKHGQRTQSAACAAAVAEEKRGLRAPEPSEREVRTVVSSWVREHRQHAEEFQRNYASILCKAGLMLPSACAASRA